MADPKLEDVCGKARRAKRAYKPRDPEKQKARWKVHYEVEKGRLPHPNSQPCVSCGHIWSEGETRHEYDHYLGYAGEHHLSVEVVCKRCHTQRDNKFAKQTHCKNGHEFSEENTHWYNNRRKCKKCIGDYRDAYIARNVELVRQRDREKYWRNKARLQEKAA